MATTVSTTSQSFEHIVRFVAIQLLASCYTLLPPTSACSVSLLEQRKGPRLITALRLHTYFRYAPAAGYHARDPSETTPWPGLYRGPPIEEKIANAAMRHSRRTKESSKYRKQGSIDFRSYGSASNWSDGPTEEIPTRTSSPRSSGDSDSSIKKRLNWKSLCQPLASRGSGRKVRLTKQHSDTSHQKKLHFFTWSGRQGNKRLDHQTSSKSLAARPKPILPQKAAADATYKMPSKLHLRKTHSAPRTPMFENPLETMSIHTRRSSSTPTFGALMPYPFEIPEIRRISASTTAASLRSSFMKLPSRSFDSSRLHPFREVPSCSNPSTPTGEISPMSLALISEAITGTNSQQTDYFSLPPFPLPEDLRGAYKPDGYGASHSVVEGSDSSSEDFLPNDQKRRPSICTVSDDTDSIERRLSEGDSLKSGGSSRK